MLVRSTLALALAASPAAALDEWAGVAAPNRMSLKPGEGPCFAIVEVENRAGSYNQPETLETEHGPVTFSYRTVGGHRPGDDDVVTVVSLPTDVLAEPPELGIPDGETGSICLIRWQGA